MDWKESLRKVLLVPGGWGEREQAVNLSSYGEKEAREEQETKTCHV